MTTPASSRRPGRQLFRLPAGLPPGSALGILGLFVLAFLAVSHAQQAAPSGEELYVDRLGCWNCHGKGGGGGAGPSIVKSRLPLRKFVQSVRLPSAEMPPFASLLASDAELAIVYHWLGGADAVTTPSPMTIDLKASAQVKADGQTRADTEVDVMPLAGDTNVKLDDPRAAALRDRVTLAQANGPIANQTVEYQLAGHGDWSKFTTDEHGEALLDAGHGFVVADGRETEKDRAAARLRTALAPGRYVLVVEAIDYTNPDSPVVVGIGTAILRVE